MASIKYVIFRFVMPTLNETKFETINPIVHENHFIWHVAKNSTNTVLKLYTDFVFICKKLE